MEATEQGPQGTLVGSKSTMRSGDQIIKAMICQLLSQRYHGVYGLTQLPLSSLWSNIKQIYVVYEFTLARALASKHSDRARVHPSQS